MIYNEANRDLLTVPDDYYLAHCISADFALGTGIAKKFDEKYNIRYKLFERYSMPGNVQNKYIGRALLIGKVFNLVTKAHYFQNPTYDTLYESLTDMKDQCVALGIQNLAMPTIGCEKEKLDWNQVREDVLTVFDDTDMTILVCKN